MMKPRFLPAFLLLIFLAAFTISSCSSGDDDDDANPPIADDDDDSSADDDDDNSDAPFHYDCDAAYLQNGFGLGWKRLNHRISLWESLVDQPPCPSSQLEDITLKLGYIGGDFSTGAILSDTPLYLHHGTFIDTKGTARFESRTVEMFLEPGQSIAETTLDFTPEAKGAQFAFWVTGLSIETDIEQTDPDYPPAYDPAMGYTVRGFGAGVEVLNSDSEKTRVRVFGRFETGPADRPDMNEAMQHARVAFAVQIMAVETVTGEIFQAENEYTLSYPPPTFPIPQQIDHADATLRAVVMEISPERPAFAAGLTHFDFSLFESVENGDYIRELSVRAVPFDYNSQTGQVKIDLDGYASNSSLIAYETMESDFSAGITLVQFPAGRIIANTLTGSFETGRKEISLGLPVQDVDLEKNHACCG